MTTSAAPTPSSRPQSRPTRAPETSLRPQPRPTAAPETSLHPQARPSDDVRLSRESQETKSQASAPRVQGLMEAFGMGPSSPDSTNQRILEEAESRVGETFKPGVDARCADFVSNVISATGANPDGFSPTLRARDFGEMGAQSIDFENLEPGDVVAFNNTYRNSADEADHTHVGVYAGEGMFIHRPTSGSGYQPGMAPGEVVKESLDDYLARDRDYPASFASGYRFP